MPAYPGSLPVPLVEGYALNPVDQTVRTEMEAGAARVRRRTFARNDVVDVAFIFTGGEFAAFRTWFEGDAGGGSAWFDMPLDVGAGMATEEVRFKGAWKSQRVQLHWRVTAQLEVR